MSDVSDNLIETGNLDFCTIKIDLSQIMSIIGFFGGQSWLMALSNLQVNSSSPSAPIRCYEKIFHQFGESHHLQNFIFEHCELVASPNETIMGA